MKARAVSSVYGRIRQLVLAYPGGQASVSEALVLERYAAIFNAFPTDVGFVVMGRFDADLMEKIRERYHARSCMESVVEEDQLSFCPMGLPLDIQMPDQRNHSEFVQDAFLPLAHPLGIPLLLESIPMLPRMHATLGEALSAGLNCGKLSTHLFLEGGNILVGDDYALIGRNTLAANQKLAKNRWGKASPELLEAEIQCVLGIRHLVDVGLEQTWENAGFVSNGEEGLQPFFHLDLFITLLGKDFEGKEMALVAEIKPDHVQGFQEQDGSKLQELGQQLDQIANQLQQYSGEGPRFTVLRNPLGGRMMESRNSQRKFLPFSHNNALVECCAQTRAIYLPSYPGMELLEANLKLQLQQCGFDRVVFIANAFEYYALRSGSLRCITTVLKRSEGNCPEAVFSNLDSSNGLPHSFSALQPGKV